VRLESSTAELWPPPVDRRVRDRGHAWNRKRVARLMRLGAIEGATTPQIASLARLSVPEVAC
jgi:hypothetical protein